MTISKKNGKYYCRFQIDGKRYFRACKNAKSVKEAKLYELELMANIDEYQEKDELITLSEMMKYFLEYSKTNKKSYVQDVYRSKIILDFFGKHKDIKTIRTAQIERFKQYLLECRTQVTANRYLENLSKMFNLAIENEWLDKNPISKKSKFKAKNYSLRYLTESEKKRLLESCDGILKKVVIVALNTGLRKSNILKLKWENINFDFRMIELTENKGNKHLKIYMNDELYNLFKSMTPYCEYVFANPQTNKPYKDLRKPWVKALKKARIYNFRFHDLRHTVGTTLAKKGVPVNVIKHILGHSDVSTTMQYIHIASEDVKKAMESL